jgi:hypothetical protein
MHAAEHKDSTGPIKTLLLRPHAYLLVSATKQSLCFQLPSADRWPHKPGSCSHDLVSGAPTGDALVHAASLYP